MSLKRVIVAHLYQPGSAATNRILAYARGFVHHGVEVILLLGSHVQNAEPVIEGNNGFRVIMVCAPRGYKLNKSLAERTKDFYNSSSAILIYGTPALCWFLPKNKYNIFYECTEIPFYGRGKTLSTRIKEFIKNYLSHRATGMMVISKALARYFAERGIKNITVINMFVDTTRFDKANSVLEGKYIAYCGTVSPYKDGVDNLIQAFVLFSSSHSDYSLIIIGKFESREAEIKLRALVKKLGVESKVFFIGMVEPSMMPSYLCGARMLALARPDNEQARYGFPTKLGEYLATGKPVVLTQVGEISDFLCSGVNCFMSEPGNIVAFANSLSWVADHYEDAIKLGEAGRQLTLSVFSSTKQSKKALSFMESCMLS